MRRRKGGAGTADTPAAGGSPAQETYRREKARRATKPTPTDEALAAAQREYDALMASQASAGRRGRPKKIVHTVDDATDGDD